MKGRLIAVVVFLASAGVFFLSAGVVFWFALVHTVHLGTLSVPDLLGHPSEEAEQIAHDMGITLLIEDIGIYSASMEVGAVARQNPSPGFHVKTGSTVRAWLSLGAERVTIPDLKGESLQGALRALEQVGLHAGRRTEIHGHAAAGTVVASDPPVGVQVAPGYEVNLLINVEPAAARWVMPSLIEQPVAVARSFCRRSHLRLAKIHERPYFPGFPGGTVLRQHPRAGTPVSRADPVIIEMSVSP